MRVMAITSWHPAGRTPPIALKAHAEPSSTAVPSISATDYSHRLLGRGETTRFQSVITDNFRADVAARCYRLDRVSSHDWLLVYNFRVSSVLFSVGRFALALICVFVAIAVDDFVRVGGGKFTIPKFQRLHCELEAFGIIGKCFAVLVLLVFCALIRIRMLVMTRVYVHRTEPSRICANIARGLFSKKMVELDRSQIRTVPAWLKLHDTPIEPGWGSYRAVLKRVIRFLVYADVRLGKHGSRMFYTDGFRTNALRNWALNERDAVPKRELNLLDIGVESVDAEWRRNLRWWQRIFQFF